MRQLYCSPNSPYARKVRIVLKEQGLDYEETMIDAANPPEAMAKLNPNRKIPVLVDGSNVLFESNVVEEYLLRSYPGAGGGIPRLAESVTRPDHHWEDAAILSTIETALDSGALLFQAQRAQLAADKLPWLQRELARAKSCLDWLETRASAEGFIPGRFSIQDVNAVCLLAWADLRQPFVWRGRKKLEALLQRYQDRPSVKATHPPG